jgi:hypothetical protein
MLSESWHNGKTAHLLPGSSNSAVGWFDAMCNEYVRINVSLLESAAECLDAESWISRRSLE